MKYSQFLQLSEILEKQDKNISEIILDNKLLDINEDVKDLETETGGIITRWGRMKTKLNKVAKDTQKQLQDKVLNKYFPEILNNEKRIAEKVKGKEKDAKKLKELVISNHKAIQSQQTKQISIIDGAIEQFLGNITQKMNTKIDNSKITDNNKARLKNYWILLTTQISMNASIYMNEEREKIIDDIFAGNKQASEEAKKQIDLGRKKKAEKQKKVENNKARSEKEAKEAEAEETTTQPATPTPAQPAAPAPTPAQPAAPAPAPAQPAAPAPAPAQPAAPAPAQPAAQTYAIGQKYNFTKTNGKPGKLTVLKQDGDQFTLKTDEGKAQFTRSKEWMDKNVKESIEEPYNRKMVAENLHEFLN